MSEFVFDEEHHIYRRDGKILPSVTGIIKPLVDFSAVPYDVMERARLFGNGVHKTVELELKDDLDEDALDAPLYGCLLAFRAFRADHWDIFEENPIAEKPGYHARLGYAGTPDLDFPSWMIEVKSRKCNPLTDAIQLILYDNMTGNGKRNHAVLELTQDASYVFTPLNQTDRKRKESWSRARYLLDYHNMSTEIRRWK
jgi:hypothetical protein